MDFLEFIGNKEIEIHNNKIYERYYLDNSLADPNCYIYEIEDSHNMVGFQKFWVKEYGRITDYILVVDYNVVGDIFGYKVVKGFDEKEVGFLCKMYGSSGEYYKFQPSFLDDVNSDSNTKKESSSSYSTSSSSSSNSNGMGLGSIIAYIVVAVVLLVGFLCFILGGNPC